MAPKRALPDTSTQASANDTQEPSTTPPTSPPSSKRRKLSPSPESTLSHPKVLKYPNVSNATPKNTQFQKPAQLISFSYSSKHELEFSNAALRYFVDPPLGAKLGYGYDRWIRKPDDRGRLDGLLRAISTIRKDPSRKGATDVALVTWRGVMTKILTAPYEDRDGWELNVMFVNGTLYLEEHVTDARLKEKNEMEPRQRLQTYYGYAFESYCTSDTPTRRHTSSSVPTGWGGDVDTNVQWCSVVRTKLGDVSMIIGGEVDCVRGKYTEQPDTFMELKTSMTIRGLQDETRFERKLLKFYFQSFLLGVPEILVGFRTPAGVLTTTQSFQTLLIPRLVRGKPGAWNPLVCLEWGQQFLLFLKDIIRAEGPDNEAVWRVRFIPGSGTSAQKLDRNGVRDVTNGEERMGFLPTWYWNELQGGQSSHEERAGESNATSVAGAVVSGWQI